MKLKKVLILFVLTCTISLFTSTGVVRAAVPGAIVIAPKTNPIAKFAAEELQHYLAEATGTKLPIVDHAKTVSGNSVIYVGLGASDKITASDTKDLYPGGYLIQRVGDDLIILGDDQARGKQALLPFDERVSRKGGTLFGVYRYLEQFYGVRWLWPGKSGEVVPTGQKLTLPATVNQRSRPAMPWRHLFLTGKLTPQELKACRLWYIRQGMGVGIGTPFSFGHSWAKWLDGNANFKKHPDWYALIDGKRRPFYEDKNGKVIAMGRQINTADPEVVAYVAQRIADAYPADADTIVSLSPNDGLGFCQDAACKALDHPELYEPWQGYQGVVYSDRIYTFVNQVANIVHKTHPNLHFGCFSYTVTRPAPRAIDKLNSNIVVSLTQQSQKFMRNPELRQRHQRRLDAWLKLGNKIVLRDYIGFVYQGAAMEPMTRWIGDMLDVAQKHPDQIMGFYSETTYPSLVTNHLSFYVLARKAWDPTLSVDAIKADFFQHGFGPAATAMSQVNDTLEQAYESVPDPHAAYARGLDLWLTPKVIDQARQGYREAQRAAAGQTQILHRIAVVEKMFQYTVDLRNVVASMRALADMGLPIKIRDYTPRPTGRHYSRQQILAKLDEALQAYSQLTTFMRQHSRSRVTA